MGIFKSLIRKHDGFVSDLIGIADTTPYSPPLPSSSFLFLIFSLTSLLLLQKATYVQTSLCVLKKNHVMIWTIVSVLVMAFLRQDHLKLICSAKDYYICIYSNSCIGLSVTRFVLTLYIIIALTWWVLWDFFFLGSLVELSTWISSAQS